MARAKADTAYEDVDLLTLEKWADLPQLAAPRAAVSEALKALETCDQARREALERQRTLALELAGVSRPYEHTTLAAARIETAALEAQRAQCHEDLLMARANLATAEREVRTRLQPKIDALLAPIRERLLFLESIEAVHRLCGLSALGEYRAVYRREAIYLRKLIMSME
ncbi:MAG: hypothetical protein AB7N91_23720 [Candidatus Tectimicrobiota bacterium]